MEVRKHRLEQKNYSYDFGPQLAEGDSLTGTPSVKLIRHGTEDVTGQFGDTNPSIDETKVVFTLHEASADQQDGGIYALLIEVDTSSGEHLVGEVQDATSGSYRRPILRVYEDADVGAP